MDDKTALAFNTICNFIRDLNASFGNKQKSLMLYGHLIEKTGLIHMEPVKKHISIFKAFVQANEDAIEKRNKKLFKTGKIMYSERVAIDLLGVFQMCDRDEESVIWNHLLTISAVLDPNSNAKKVLKEMRETKSTPSGAGGGMEDNFLKNIIDKIGNEISTHDGEDLNPMQMIGSMMSSGVLNDVFQSLSTGMNDGNMDLGKMMASMQGLMQNLNTMVGENSSGDTKDHAPSVSLPSTTTTDNMEALPPQPSNPELAPLVDSSTEQVD